MMFDDVFVFRSEWGAKLSLDDERVQKQTASILYQQQVPFVLDTNLHTHDTQA